MSPNPQGGEDPSTMTRDGAPGAGSVHVSVQTQMGAQTQVLYVDNKGATYSAVIPSITLPGNVETSTSAVEVGTVTAVVTYSRVIEETNTYIAAVDAAVMSTTKPTITSASVKDTPQASAIPNASSSTSTSSPSPTESNKVQGSKGLSSGAAAGIGIGAAMGGILLASLVFFFCSRRSRKSEPRYNPEIPLKHSPSYGENKTTSLPQVTAIDTWNNPAEKHLPQPVADETISSEMSKLKSMINNHVVSYYRTSEIDLDAIDETTLADLMEISQMSVSQMTSAIVNPQTRTPALRCLIASAIFSRIGLKSHPSSSFLPPEVAGCLESMTGMQDNDHARTALLSKWRAITASMLEQTYSSKPITESDPRSYNIGRALEELDSVLIRLKARRDENASRRQNLEEILKRAAAFAFLLFSHPSFWKFGWQTGLSHEPGCVVIFPALLQITDENGERLGRPRPFEEMETARLIT